MNPVLPSIAPLIRKPQHVTIDNEKLDELVDDLEWEKLEMPRWDDANYPTKELVNKRAFAVLENSMNFAFNNFATGEKFSAEYKGKTWPGSQGYLACLTRALEAGKPLLDPQYLRRITRKECAEIFKGNFEIPMLDERHRILNQLGAVLTTKYHGFAELLDTPVLFNGRDGLVERLQANIPSYQDECVIDRQRVVFAKRAQLAAIIIAGQEQDNPPWSEDQLRMLTIPSDYVIPRFLRDRGILKYDAALAAKVDSGTLLTPYSREECEMRASAIVVARRVRNLLEERGVRSNECHIDYFLWSNGRKIPREKRSREHLCRTIAY